MKQKRGIFLLSVLFFCFLYLSLLSQNQVELEIEKVSGNVYCLFGEGGNVGIVKSEEGLLLVDSQYDRIANKILEKLKSISSMPIKILINTHYHGDHTSGNEILGKSAELIMHKNCKESWVQSLAAQKEGAVTPPAVTTYETEKDLQFGREKAKLIHFGPAHTAGDTVVVFETSKVIHAGDQFFNGIPPYIDVGDGADTANWIMTIEELCKKYPDFNIIPGHGRVTDTKRFLYFADYLKYLREKVHTAIKEGKTREQAMNEINLDRFAEIKDQGTFLTKKQNIGWVYDEMKKKQK